MPAKAGIQTVKNRIPAFAGMTIKVMVNAGALREHDILPDTKKAGPRRGRPGYCSYS
jgi:hypothetical protein